jgi:hypothetical protein
MPRFVPGVSGNPAGRPKGSRNALSEEFISALADEWDERGRTALRELTGEQLVNVVAKVLPREFQVDTGETYADLVRRAAELTAQREHEAARAAA